MMRIQPTLRNPPNILAGVRLVENGQNSAWTGAKFQDSPSNMSLDLDSVALKSNHICTEEKF